MKVMVKKRGDSASVRIPTSIVEAAGLHLDQPVDVREEKGQIVIQSIRPEAYDITTLVAGIIDENRHEVVESGPAIGQEAW